MRGAGWDVGSEAKSIYERLQELDPRYVYLLVIIVISLPLLRPIGIPLGMISGETLELYRYIDTLPPGSVILMIADQSPAAAAECQPGMLALFQHAVNKGLRVMFFAARTDAVPFISEAFIKVLGKESEHPDYGKRYVNLGFIPQYEVGLTALAANLLYTTRDAYGKELKDMEFFSDLPNKNAKDLKLAIYYGASAVDWVVRQLTDPYGVPAGGGVAAVLASRIYPYYPDKVVGFLTGLKGSAEYEVLVKRPGEAVAGMDAQSLGHLAIVIMVILGNIGYAFSRRGRASRGGG